MYLQKTVLNNLLIKFSSKLVDKYLLQINNVHCLVGISLNILKKLTRTKINKANFQQAALCGSN